MNPIEVLKSHHLSLLREIIAILDYYKILEIQDQHGYFTIDNIPTEILNIIGDNKLALAEYKKYLEYRNQLHEDSINHYFGR